MISTAAAVVTATKILTPELIFRNGYYITNNLISSLSYLKSLSHADTELADLLSNIDLLEDIGIIKSFIEEKKIKTDSLTIQVCIENLNKTLSLLEENINSITTKIESHKNLWFNYFRSYDIYYEKNQIPKLAEQMKHRFEILIKISSVI